MAIKAWHSLTNKLSSKSLGLGVFGRAFLALFVLLLFSLSAWLFGFLVAQQEPRATQLAERAVTAYHITQRALRFTPPDKHASLIMEFATTGNIQLFPRELSDVATPLPNTAFWNTVRSKISGGLIPDPNFVIASEINSTPGLWISFNTQDNTSYWLLINYQSQLSDINREWIYWTLIATVLSLIGAAFLAFIANKPLSYISQFVRAVSLGETPPLLPENKGPQELRNLYGDLNQMVADLHQLETDRHIMIAGISHDLRTPLARMRLELELSNINLESQQAIDGDLEQINHCISQLAEYARPVTYETAPLINISTALTALCRQEVSYTAGLHGVFDYHIEPDLYANISETNLRRIVSNLIENARKYGKSKNGEMRVELKAYRHHNNVFIDVMDYGRGISPAEIPRLLRPFARGEEARTGVDGSGLGLAICERLLKQSGGKLKLLPNKPHGLLCRIEISLNGN